jgi:hypothetical protein
VFEFVANRNTCNLLQVRNNGANSCRHSVCDNLFLGHDRCLQTKTSSHPILVLFSNPAGIFEVAISMFDQSGEHPSDCSKHHAMLPLPQQENRIGWFGSSRQDRSKSMRSICVSTIRRSDGTRSKLEAVAIECGSRTEGDLNDICPRL